MSKESYMNGFCKAAEAKGVDPRELASYAMAKVAEGKPGFLSSLGTSISNGVGDFANWWKNEDKDAGREALKGLIGAAGGGALGLGLGAAISGKKGIRPGSIIGALVGAGGAVNWDAVRAAIDKISAESAARNAAGQAAAPAPAPADNK